MGFLRDMLRELSDLKRPRALRVVPRKQMPTPPPFIAARKKQLSKKCIFNLVQRPVLICVNGKSLTVFSGADFLGIYFDL